MTRRAGEADEGFDAVVVGAGLAGTSASILLARAGWRVALVEKRRFPRRKVCGECIAASNLPLLHALGIGEAFDALAGAPLERVTLLHRDRRVSARLPRGRDDRFPWGRALGRETLDSLLLERARAEGVSIRQPWRVHGIDGTPGDWRCALRSSTDRGEATLRAPVLIDAHGSWEPLSNETAAATDRVASDRVASDRVASDRVATDLLAFKANFSSAALEQGTIGVLALDGGYGGMVVGDGGIATLACCVRRDRLDGLRRAAPGARAGDAVEGWLKAQCVGVERALDGAVRESGWLASGPLRPGVRVDGDDGILRIGNAAGEAHPILGEGMSMALQSGAMLAARLIEDGRPAAEIGRCRALRDGHAHEWRATFAPRLRVAATFAHVAMRPLGSTALMSLSGVWPRLLTCGATLGGKVRLAVDPERLAIRDH